MTFKRAFTAFKRVYKHRFIFQRYFEGLVRVLREGARAPNVSEVGQREGASKLGVFGMRISWRKGPTFRLQTLAPSPETFSFQGTLKSKNAANGGKEREIPKSGKRKSFLLKSFTSVGDVLEALQRDLCPPGAFSRLKRPRRGDGVAARVRARCQGVTELHLRSSATTATLATGGRWNTTVGRRAGTGKVSGGY